MPTTTKMLWQYGNSFSKKTYERVRMRTRERERKKNNEMVFGSLPIREVGNNKIGGSRYFESRLVFGIV